MFQHPEQDTDPQLCSCPATLGLDACPTQRGCWLPALLPWLYSYVIYLLYLLYFIDRSTAQCANSWETGQAVLVRGRCCSNYANAQARPIWPRCLWKLFWKTRHDRMDFNLVTKKKILCQQPSIRLSGNSHPPAGFIQGLNSFGLRLDWHLLASIAALKERLEQSWQEAELSQRKRWKETSCITSKWQRMLHGDKLHSNKGSWSGNLKKAQITASLCTLDCKPYL